jgi:DNA-binding beta-propeller fold protein YncE
MSALLASSPALAQPPYTLFESGQVRPLTMSPNGQLLFALNTPDNRLEVFRAHAGGLTHRASIPVGLEPVAVAARSNTEVWVVNHLSDSISVVELSAGGIAGRVVRTLLVGDEPRDIVFAGPGKRRAFITTAHRGQNIPFDPQLSTPGIGRADVWVFDSAHLGASLGGDPLTIITLFSDTPRALAATPDGTRVYAAAFHSGNRTTIVSEQFVDDGFGPTGVAGPATNADGDPAPEVGVIVKHDGAHWRDDAGRDWDAGVRLSLPDKDVFVINAMTNPPAQLGGPSGYFTGVGTVLFNMIVNPVSGKVYVSNTEAMNDVRFEGPGDFAGSSVRGHLHESRITVLGAGSVTPRHLNKHIDFTSCCAPVPNAENARSLAQPLDMAITSNGQKLYVAAHGSNKVGVFNTAALENDTFMPSTANQITVSGGGPSGLALDEQRGRLYVLTRFDNGISIIKTSTGVETAHLAMHNPEPPSVTDGRRFLYDAALTSSHGDSSCASCHIFGDFDSLAWDLGNPDASMLDNPGPFGNLTNLLAGGETDPTFHPMKGPMSTQSLRGMANHGSMHWRGDRTGGNDAPTAQPDSGTHDERAAFEKFQDGFTDLLGRHAVLDSADMDAFTDFILQVTYPPNPNRNLDNSLTPAQQIAEDFYFNTVSDGTDTCNGCHTLDPAANPSTDKPGFFGTSALTTWDFQPRVMKVPHLRNLYQKVGMFGASTVQSNPFDDLSNTGDQVRGFGFAHDGNFDTVFRFMRTLSFSDLLTTPFVTNPDGIPYTPQGDELRRALDSFMMAYPSNMAPIVGQQITLTHTNGAVVGPRINLLIARAQAGECDLIAKSSLLGHEFGFFYEGGHFTANRQATPALSDAHLRQLSVLAGLELTYTCAPPGSGERMGIDRDLDGFLDGDEQHQGSDPADPSSTP